MSYDAWKLMNPYDRYDESAEERRDRLDDESDRRYQANQDAEDEERAAMRDND